MFSVSNFNDIRASFSECGSLAGFDDNPICSGPIRSGPLRSGRSFSVQLTSKTAVITGAAKGIGRAIALRFARHGANVALLDLDEQALEDTRQQCAAHHITARTYAASVAKEEDVIRALSAVVSDFGSLDVMINNAGIIRDALLVKGKEGGRHRQDEPCAVAGRDRCEPHRRVPVRP